MIARATLAEMVAATRLDATLAAIVASLGALLGGVTVVLHPGKLDINDVVAKAIVQPPGVAVGYTRVRELGDPGGTFSAGIDAVAYIVVEDLALPGPPPRAVERTLVGHAIGMQILRILRDLDAASWGLLAIEPPQMEPPPELRPLFTMRSAEQATAIYAVTWTQALVQEGTPFFDGPTPEVEGIGVPEGDAAGLPGDVAGDDEVIFDLPPGDENDYPPEILAYLRRGGPMPGDP